MYRSMVALMGLGAMLMGCGVEGEALDDAAIGETSSALCTDAGAANYSAALGSGWGASVSATSPTSTYGSAACQSRYVVEATNTLGKSFTISASWGEALPTTQQACPFALVEATAYGFKGGQWHTIGQKSAGGQWVELLGFCQLGVSFQLDLSQYSKIRIAAKAAALAVFVMVPKRVTAGVALPGRPPA